VRSSHVQRLGDRTAAEDHDLALDARAPSVVTVAVQRVKPQGGERASPQTPIIRDYGHLGKPAPSHVRRDGMAGFVICSCTESPVEGHVSTLSERCGISKNDN
jgi:hypothetical protein